MSSTEQRKAYDDGQKTNDVGEGGAGGSSGGGFVYVLSSLATLGGLLFGYDTGIVSGSMLLIKPYFKLDTIWTEAVVSGTIGAAALSSIFAGICTDVIGRKKTIMAASVIFATGAVVMAIAPTAIVLLVGRIIVGVGIGFASMSVPVYVAEAAPADIRGRLVTLNQLFICIGILISSIIAGSLSSLKQTGWRYMLGLGGVPAVIQFIGFIFLPESPRWLVGKGREEDARQVLMKIRNTQNVKVELEEIKEVVARDNKIKEEEGNFTLGRIIKTPHVLKASLIGSALMLFQQLTGINTVIYYSATILRMAGFGVDQAIWLAVVPNAVLFVATFLGLWLVEKLGRKLLLLISLGGVGLSLAVLAVAFQLAAFNSPPVNITEVFTDGLYNGSCNTKYSNCESCIDDTSCGFCYDDLSRGSCLPVNKDKEELSLIGRCQYINQPNNSFHFDYGFCRTNYSWMPVLGMVFFVFSFAPGMGPMPWTINSEIYPLWARSTCISISTATNWAFNLLVSFTFITMTENITKYGTFWLFSGVCILGFIFVLIFIPETRDKTLEEVEQLFMSTSVRAQKQTEMEIYNVRMTEIEHQDTRF
ncbi:hypothetical protein SNE40_013507 [Patella caerulea]|uniref:Major facilitator superfamily (MFS) profile domain-containing protein n=1 Tax=Patella caerulea TaxID=87958 RepID=A0AAN8PNR3_PATCE